MEINLPVMSQRRGQQTNASDSSAAGSVVGENNSGWSFVELLSAQKKNKKTI